MMKLYGLAGSCSMSCHFALEASGLPYEMHLAKWGGTPELWKEIQARNPDEAVPVLVTEEGRTLLQNAAILAFIADRAAKASLLPAAGTYDRAHVMQWVAFVASDLHKAMGTLFSGFESVKDDSLKSAIREEELTELNSYLATVEGELAKGAPFICGPQPTIADCYLFTVLSWSNLVKVSYETFPQIRAYQGRMMEQAFVRKVMADEGLLK